VICVRGYEIPLRFGYRGSWPRRNVRGEPQSPALIPSSCTARSVEVLHVMHSTITVVAFPPSSHRPWSPRWRVCWPLIFCVSHGLYKIVPGGARSQIVPLFSSGCPSHNNTLSDMLTEGCGCRKILCKKSLISTSTHSRCTPLRSRLQLVQSFLAQ
jgi:hypothetical protein